MKQRPLKVGDKLHFVASTNAKYQQEVTVQKVGRKWATLSNRHRIGIEDWIADGGQYVSPGCCYENQEEYKAEIELCNAWRDFTTQIGRTYNYPPDTTIAKIKTARILLNIPENKVIN